jgi:hypothetical protein
VLVERLRLGHFLQIFEDYLTKVRGRNATPANRSLVESSLSVRSRTALDEVLREMRAGRQVHASRTIGGTLYTTGASAVILEAPGYDTTTTPILLPGIYDLILFRHDAARGALTETIVRDTGSTRPVRTEYVLARNVRSVEFLYRVRDTFTATSGQGAFVLNAAADTTQPISAYLNGTPVPCTYAPKTRTATLSQSPAGGADVQFVYTVSPAADGGQWLARVNPIEVRLTAEQADGRNVARQIILTGNARLRNRRD